MIVCAMPPRRLGEMPYVYKWKNDDFTTEPPVVVSEEINDFSLRYLASDLYWLIEREGKQGIKKAVLALRNLIEEACKEAGLR